MVFKTKPGFIWLIETIPVSQDWGKPLAGAASFGFRAEQDHTRQPGLGVNHLRGLLLLNFGWSKTIPVSQDWGKPLARAASFGFWLYGF